MLHLTSKTRNYVFIIWLVTFMLLYYLFNKRSELEVITDQTPPNSSSSSTSLSILSTHKLDAVVFIAMGVMAAETTIDYSILSLRQLGRYTGPIFIITDSPACFESMIMSTGKLFNQQTQFIYTKNDDFVIKIIEIPPQKSITRIKALKTQVLDLLPIEYKSILYLDVDILVTKPLHSFLYDVIKTIIYSKKQWQKAQKQKQTLPQLKALSSSTLSTPPSSSASASNSLKDTTTITTSTTTSTTASQPLQFFDLGTFYDAMGHYVGFCSGCEKWHTGILLYQRGHGTSCLKAWGDILLSGKFDTDQQSLDEAEAVGSCRSIVPFPKNHLLFAKDYIGWFFTSGHTFIHITAAGRLQDQGYFYREVVVPRLRGSLHIPPALLKETRKCAIGTVGSTIINASSSSKIASDVPNTTKKSVLKFTL